MTFFRRAQKILRISAWKMLLHSDMHACFLTLFYLLLVDGIKVSSYDPILRILALLVSLGTYLACGTLVNDYFDMRTDKIAGRKREIDDIPEVKLAGLILLLVLFGLLITVLLIGQTLYTIIYLIACILGTFYSAPPVRLKGRGMLGMICVALIEKPFPVLLIFSFFQHFRLDTLMFFSMFFVLQVEMIMHHHFHHYEGDLKAQVKTYVVEIGLEKTMRMLDYLQSLVAVLFLVFCVSVLIRITYSVIFLLTIVVGYFLVRRIKRLDLLIREPKSLRPSRIFAQNTVTPFYYSFIFICLTGLFPLFLGFAVTLTAPSYMFLLLLTIGSQYDLIRKHYLPALKGVFSLITR